VRPLLCLQIFTLDVDDRTRSVLRTRTSEGGCLYGQIAWTRKEGRLCCCEGEQNKSRTFGTIKARIAFFVVLPRAAVPFSLRTPPFLGSLRSESGLNSLNTTARLLLPDSFLTLPPSRPASCPPAAAASLAHLCLRPAMAQPVVAPQPANTTTHTSTQPPTTFKTSKPRSHPHRRHPAS
jgi:hypothetical protein